MPAVLLLETWATMLMNCYTSASDRKVRIRGWGTVWSLRSLTCMITLRSAFPVRMSYSVKVRSDPTLARTDASDKLNRTEVIVSVEVGNVRFEIGAVLALAMVRK